MKWKKGTFKSRMVSGWEEKQGYLSDDGIWGIYGYRENKFWCVVHLNTGHALCWKSTLAEAKETVEKVSTKLDWKNLTVQQSKKMVGSKLYAEITAIARSPEFVVFG